MIKLKRCPRCNTYFGGMTLWQAWPSHWWQKKYHVECNYCHWCGKKAMTKRGAARNWNRDKERKKNGKG